jgi:hypothetical protein
MLLDIKDRTGRRRGFAVRLGSINRWLRYTGDRPWTTIGVA